MTINSICTVIIEITACDNYNALSIVYCTATSIITVCIVVALLLVNVQLMTVKLPTILYMAPPPPHIVPVEVLSVKTLLARLKYREFVIAPTKTSKCAW